MISIEELKKGAVMHRQHARKFPSEYRRNFENAEYFVVFPEDDASFLIEPLGWALRALESDGLKKTKAVSPAKGQQTAVSAGMELVTAASSDFQTYWEAIISWTETKKMKPLSSRTTKDRQVDTYFYVASRG